MWIPGRSPGREPLRALLEPFGLWRERRFTAPCPRDEAERRLLQATTRCGWFHRGDPAARFLGTVEDGAFRLVLKPDGQNSWPTVGKGRVAPAAGGSEVRMALYAHPAGLALSVTLLAGGGVPFLLGLDLEPPRLLAYDLALAALVAAFVLSIPWVCYLYEAVALEKELRAALGAPTLDEAAERRSLSRSLRRLLLVLAALVALLLLIRPT